MRKHSLIIAFSLFVLLSVMSGAFKYDAPDFGNMQVLTDTNMDLTMTQSGAPIWVVTFYVPWCQHTKTLAPLLDQVGTELIEQGFKIDFGTVDVM